MKDAGDMTSLERVNAVLKGEVPDRVPVFTCGNGIIRHMLGVSYGQMMQDVRLISSAMLQWQDLLGDDRVMAYFDMMVEAAGFGQRMIYQDDQPPYSDKRTSSSRPRTTTSSSSATTWRRRSASA